ncbi:hypothetical protein [Oricola cellulosilytica]|uniref:Uncharacterized protein n=1 Tax=Oricola cellulosilytica TaxID=1429082 RepID=A0A4R0PKK2_9HYPH|nr:hypothetical protein [Oricola cellulosilytica]TCD16099.1 hypothetical protein E0D97_01270 [Oricola cellulosilytica]
MIRFLFRILAFLAFAIAIMFAVIDATRSIGVSAFVFTTFLESFELAAPQALENLRNFLTQNVPPFVSDRVLASILQIPTFAVFAVLSVLLYAIGRRPERRRFRRAVG